MSSQLTPQELTCLLNYILGLPVKRNGTHGFARRERLDPVVVGTWLLKERIRIQCWAEGMLMRDQVMPGKAEGHLRLIPAKLLPWSLPVSYGVVRTSVRDGKGQGSTRIGQVG